MNNETERSADTDYGLSNYKSAAKLYANLKKSTLNIEDRIYIDNRIKTCNDFYRRINQLSSGEAFFPVINQALNNSAILTLKITGNISGSRQLDIDYVKKSALLFLDDYVYNNIKTTVVTDWKIDELVAEVKKIPNPDKEFKNFIQEIDGRSYELAAAISLISKIINVIISNRIIFSGLIEHEKRKINILSADELNDKLKCVKAERPNAKSFVIAKDGKIKNDKIIKRFYDFSELVKHVFPDFEDHLRKILKQNNDIRKISLEVKKSKTKEDKHEILVFNFKHPSSLQYNELKKIPGYFKNISPELTGKSEGIIIDGLLPSYLPAMLISSKNIANHISNFIAVRTGKTESKYASAVVVRINNQGSSTFKVGDHFLYKLP